VTPDGNAVVFQGEGGVQVYDAVRGRLLCASCNPAAPTAPASGLLPVSGGGGRLMKAYSPRWISDDGSRVFFDTVQALVPQDTNGRIDVYEWERNGAGSCAPVVPALPEPGCVYLLSGGQSPDNSYFADADANGNNVFITSRGHLAPPARNENVAMYDARVAGGFPEVSTACTGTGCQGVPPAPPAFATPSSVTFTGVGNFGTPQIAKPKTAAKVRAERRAKALKACRKVRSKRKRTACERRAKRQYGAVKPKRPRNSRRAGR